MSGTKSTTQVRIQLSTRSPDIELAEKPGPFLVPTNINRESLSTLVNELLGPSSPIRFDFLISGNFLRTDIATYLTNNGISSETTLDIEYLRALTPPTHAASFAHDDWVGSVDVLSETSSAGVWSEQGVRSGHERIASGSYDGILRIWSMSGTVIAASKPIQAERSSSHILSTKFISPTALVSGGADMQLHLWNYTEDANNNSPGSLSPTITMAGHTGLVNNIAVHTPTQQILSASSDHTARLWSSSSDPSTHPSAPSNTASSSDTATKKRRKVSSSAPTCGSLTTLSAHTRPVHGAIFHPSDHTAAYTASADRTVRTWDLTTSAAISSRTPDAHAQLLCLSAVSELGLVAAGGSSGVVYLVDPRAGASRASVAALVGHTGMVNGVAAEPDNAWGLVSASNDGVCRVWDVRNAGDTTSSDGAGAGETLRGGRTIKATYKIPLESAEARKRAKMGPGESAAVFDVVWDKRVGIVSAGEDCMVQINKGERGGA